jgi:dihydrolipoamide dehydrogenase
MLTKADVFDIVVIGAGPGGYHSALRAAQYGVSVAVVEKDKIGGSCTNIGCVPIQCFDTSVKLFDDIKKKSSIFGAMTSGEISIDFAKVVERKNKIVCEIVARIEALMNLAKIKLFKGTGKVISGNPEDGFLITCIDQAGHSEEISGKRIIIATGSVPSIIPLFNIDHEKIITSDDILSSNFTRLPKSMIIIGGGVIGCECADIFARFGVDITVIEFLDSILPVEDEEIVNVIKLEFEALGIKVLTNNLLHRIERCPGGIKVITIPAPYQGSVIKVDTCNMFEAEMCLISIGRARQSAGLGLEELGVQIQNDRILVDNATCETSVKGIYAAGDVSSHLMLAQLAFYDGDVAVTNALASLNKFKIKRRTREHFVVPYTIYTIPAIASVGMREIDAKKIYKVKTGKYFYKNLELAKCLGEEKGFLKIVVNQENDRILGATCIGYAASEIIAEVSLAIYHGITAKKLVDVVHSNPTVSELVIKAIESVVEWQSLKKG